MTKPALIHVCTEIRVDIWVRTFCGMQVRQKTDRSGWVTTSHRPVVIEDKRSAGVTCGRCWRAMD